MSSLNSTYSVLSPKSILWLPMVFVLSLVALPSPDAHALHTKDEPIELSLDTEQNIEEEIPYIRILNYESGIQKALQLLQNKLFFTSVAVQAQTAFSVLFHTRTRAVFTFEHLITKVITTRLHATRELPPSLV